jgi:hypothetical protein
MERETCPGCGSWHHVMERSAAVDELLEIWNNNSAYFVPICGFPMVAIAQPMSKIADALYIDAGPEVSEVMVCGSGVMDRTVSMLGISVPSQALTELQGVYVIPKAVTAEEIIDALPGSYAGKGPDENTKVLMIAAEGERAEFAALMLDVMMLADPEKASDLMEFMQSNP